MTRTNTEIVRKIQAEFPSLQSEKKTLEGNHGLTLHDAVRALYPTLRNMKKRGFSIREIAEKLGEYGVSIKPGTLSKYMNEAEYDALLGKSRTYFTRRVKKPAAQPSDSVNADAPATTIETE